MLQMQRQLLHQNILQLISNMGANQSTQGKVSPIEEIIKQLPPATTVAAPPAAPTAAAAQPADSKADCLSTGQYTTRLNDYISQCMGGSYPEYVNKFFNQSVNIQSQFETNDAVCTDLITGIQNAIGGASISDTMETAISDLEDKRGELVKRRDELEQKENTYSRRFIEEKINTGDSVNTSNIRMLQDKILAIVFTAYLFLAVSIIAYTAKQNNYSIRYIGIAVFMLILISILLFGLVKMLI
jgi:hypothetical protein